MNLAYCYIENNSSALDQTYTYSFDEEKVCAGKRVLVDFNHRECMAYVDHVEINSSQIFPYAIKKILRVLDAEPVLNEEMRELGKWMSHSTVSPIISAYQAMLPAQLKPKSTKVQIQMEKWVKPLEDHTITLKQKQLYDILKKRGEMKRSEWLKHSLARKLESLGCVEIYEKEKRSEEKIIEKETNIFELTDEQKNAVEKILHSEKDVVCLKGVTGSGKTEVFLHCAQQVLKQGKQVLFLVPEISLTPMMVKRVKQRFGSDVAIYHSALNSQQKYEQFQSIKNHEKKIVVGTRSAVFMPFDRLGLIIIDEEHDTSYKQASGCRYHARDVAIQRGKYHHARVVLASATPSLDTYARAVKNVYDLVEIKNRINQNMPDVKLINMNEVIRKKQSYILSDTLIHAMRETLEAHEQILLLLNRRGYQPVLKCVTCRSVVMCPHCDRPLVYHKQSETLNCHLCGYSMKKISTCPQCGGNLNGYGYGTQKLAEKVQEVFPEARIVRMDADTTTRKDAHQRLLESFEQHQGDILLGTQMIAKGLDFENVTLVGILEGDAPLERSDYRSSELAFDLLTQASGRSGRGRKKGRVLIQVYDEDHYAIDCALHQDYDRFFQNEMKYRHLAQYPPYTYLCSLIYVSRSKEEASQTAELALEELKEQNFKVLGVSELLKIQDEMRYRIIVKSKNLKELEDSIYQLYQKHRMSKSKVKLQIDMNPMFLDE